jgi:1-pyrroline-5-carboxylate dehydrogenase
VQPFGGFNMSGTDSKAGGPDYVALFTQAKVISEKL